MSSGPTTLADFLATIPDDFRECVPAQGIVPMWMRAAAAQWPVSPVQLHACAILPIIALEAARANFRVVLRSRFKPAPLAIRVCAVATSASGKSTAMKAAHAFHDQLIDRFTNGRVEKAPWMNMQGSESGLESALARFYNRDENRTLVIGFHDEMTAMLRGHAATYKVSEDWFNQAFDGASAAERCENTKASQAQAKEQNRAENPLIQGIFCTTIAALKRVVTEQHREGGMFSRIQLWATGTGGYLPPVFEEDEGTEDEAELTDADFERANACPEYEEAVLEWDAWCGILFMPPQQGADGGMARVIRWDREATRVVNRFIDEINKLPRDSDMYAAMFRSGPFVVTLAAIWALSQAHCPDRRDGVHGRVLVRADDARRAINLAKWSWRHQQAIYDATATVAQAGTISVPTQRYTDRLYACIEEAGPEGLTLSALRARVEKWAGFNASVHKAALDDLCDPELGRVVRVHMNARGRGRPKTMLYAERFAPVQKDSTN